MDPITALKCPRCGKLYYDNGHGICNECYRAEVDHPIPYSQIKKQQEGIDEDEIKEAVNSEETLPDETEVSPDESDYTEISEETLNRLAEEPIYETKAKTKPESEEETAEDDLDMKFFEPVISNTPSFEPIPVDEEEKKKKGGEKKAIKILLILLILLLLLALAVFIAYSKVYLPKVESYENALKYEESGEYEKAYEQFSLIKEYKDSKMHIVTDIQAMLDSSEFDKVYASIEEDNTLSSKLKIKEKNLYDFYDFLDEKLLTILSEDRPDLIENINLFNQIVKDMIPSQYDKYDEYIKVCSSVKESDAYSPEDDTLFYMNISDHISSYIQSGKTRGIYIDILQNARFIEYFLAGETPESRIPNGEETSNCFWSATDRLYGTNSIKLSKEKETDKSYTYEIEGKFFEKNVDGYENTSFIIQDGNFYSSEKDEEFSLTIKNFYVIQIKSIKTGESIELTRKV